jgi:hypothetical protein
MLVIETPVTSPVAYNDKRRGETQAGLNLTPAIRSPHARFLDQSTTVPASPTPRILPTVVSDSPRQLNASAVAQGYLHDDDEDEYDRHHGVRTDRESGFEGLLSESSWDVNWYENKDDVNKLCVRGEHAHMHDVRVAARDARGERMNEPLDRLMSSGLIREDLVELAKRAKLEELQDDDGEDEETALVRCVLVCVCMCVCVCVCVCVWLDT